MAINWAVNAFVIVVLFVIVLALPEWSKISFSKGLIISGHFYSRPSWSRNLVIFPIIKNGARLKLFDDSRAVKALEYTISIVSWVLQFSPLVVWRA